MIVKYFRTRCEEELRINVKNNLTRYHIQKEPWIREFFSGNKFEEEVDLNIEYPLLEETTPSSDADNAILLFTKMKTLSVEQASDQRLWAHLSHIKYYDYARIRWDINENTSANTILDRFFIKSTDSSRPLIRNAISRLWWFGYLTYDDSADDPTEMTKILLAYQDIQQVLLEHSFGKNRHIMRAFLKSLSANRAKLESYNAKPIIQGLARYVNHFGSVTFLDVLNEDALFQIMNKYLKDYQPL